MRHNQRQTKRRQAILTIICPLNNIQINILRFFSLNFPYNERSLRMTRTLQMNNDSNTKTNHIVPIPTPSLWKHCTSTYTPPLWKHCTSTYTPPLWKPNTLYLYLYPSSVETTLYLYLHPPLWKKPHFTSTYIPPLWKQPFRNWNQVNITLENWAPLCFTIVIFLFFIFFS